MRYYLYFADKETEAQRLSPSPLGSRALLLISSVDALLTQSWFGFHEF